jgi:hypothetical protein
MEHRLKTKQKLSLMINEIKDKSLEIIIREVIFGPGSLSADWEVIDELININKPELRNQPSDPSSDEPLSCPNCIKLSAKIEDLNDRIKVLDSEAQSL